MTRNSVIMVEGPDGTGKTGFAEALAMAGHARYRHYGRPTLSTWHQEFGLDIAEDDQQGVDAVHDRSIWGNAVWPSILGTTALVAPTDVIRIRDYIDTRSDSRVIILRRRTREIIATLQMRGESQQSIDAAVQSITKYEGLYALLREIGMRVDYVDSDDVFGADVSEWWDW